MPALMIRFLSTIVFATAALAVAHTAAGPVPEDDAQKILGVIVAQLDAFADDDADRAFQAATPALREAIGSSGRFLALVRGNYPMVYRPASVTFHKPQQEQGAVLQLVEITDSDAKSWLAMFEMEQQPDASWRISGCVVTENRWHAI